MSRLVIAHLYPREMNTYGDRGNVVVLRRRLEWRGHDVEVRNVDVGEPLDLESCDLVFGGGGQDSGQRVIAEDLRRRGAALRDAVDAGVPMLLVCGTYQLFGESFRTVDGDLLPGIGVFRATTTGSGTRMIGTVVVDSPHGELVGFENHSGRTELDEGQAPLGRVRRGAGNDGRSGFEGAVTAHAIGTYLHGPLLPKNPRLADHLIATALVRRFGAEAGRLAPLDDRPERAAAVVAARRRRSSSPPR